MSDRPILSVVIPTRDRRVVLTRTLAALARQSLPPQDYEVIVVADGCSDGTEEAVRESTLPYRLVVLSQPHSGAAAARNRGAAQARAPLLVLLDDDMEATSTLLHAHADAQAALPRGGVVLGAMPSAVAAGDTSDLVVESRLWWTARAREWADPRHRFTARDVFAGNVSVPRTIFDAVGGFDEAFVDCAAEDFELGIRLLAQRVPIRFRPDAAAIHHDRPSTDRLLARAAADGRGHLLIVRRHPTLASELPIGAPARGRVAGILWRVGWRWPRLVALPTFVLRRIVLPVLERARFRGPRGRVVTHLRREAYWRAIRAQLGSRAAWEMLLGSTGEAPREREFDLRLGLDALDALLAREPVDGLRLRWGAAPIGSIPALPAAESLRPAHVRAALEDRFATALLPHLGKEDASDVP